MAIENHTHPDPRVREAIGAIGLGLLSIEGAARAINERADDGFDPEETVAIAHLIEREAYSLQEAFGKVEAALKATAEVDAERRAECIYLQAQRVVQARDEVRKDFRVADADEIPVFGLSKLFAEVARLQQWLEPAEKPAEPTVRETFDKLNAIEANLRETLDAFPLPPDMTEPTHEQ